MVYFMRDAMARRLMKPGDGIQLPQLAIGEAPARQLSDSFFSMCSALNTFDEDEIRVAKALRLLINEEINTRNDIAHGDWWIFDREDQPLRATLVRLKPGRGILRKLEPWPGVQAALEQDEKAALKKDGGQGSSPRTVEYYGIADLDALTDRVEDLANFVSEFGSIALGGYPYGHHIRVRHIFVMKGKRVVREGPSAEHIEFGS